MTSTPLSDVAPGRIIIAGDWHGNTQAALDIISAAVRRDVAVILQLGDFGFWKPGSATDRYLDALESACAQHDLTLLWVDGNHECFPELYKLPVDSATGLRSVRGRIYHLPRGLRWTWHGRGWMALGGAYSVDRHRRIPGSSWWPEEFVSEEEAARAIEGGPVDVIVAHDCPDRVDIPGLAAPGVFPAAQLALSEAHREMVGAVVDSTRPSVLLHGHYHVRYTAARELSGGGRTAIIGLGDDGGLLRNNFVSLDVRADPSSWVV